ncbi:MAG: sulfite exporter TauE/SafE family protein [Proteobacteria bacterium]|nr:sulfite exporter TauE/SafE family protein [Pseudomonadota bacterium]
MEWFLLVGVTFFASLIQTVTGFGFGLLATSVFLLVLNSSGAIHLVIIITLSMCLYIWPKIRVHISIPSLSWLCLGSIVGFPLGILAFKIMNLQTLKLVVAVLILLLTAETAWRFLRIKKGLVNTKKKDLHGSRAITSVVGALSGAMSTCLAMPGPIVMIYLSRSSLSKDEIRATILTFFIFAYTGALLMQAYIVGIETEILEKAIILILPTIAGVHVGQQMAIRLNPDLFRILVLLLLTLTGCLMLISVTL